MMTVRKKARRLIYKCEVNGVNEQHFKKSCSHYYTNNLGKKISFIHISCLGTHYLTTSVINIEMLINLLIV